MASPGIGQNNGVSQSLPTTDRVSTQENKTGQASFGSGSRDIQLTEPTVSIATADTQIGEVGDTSLSERSVKDASTGAKSYLREGFALLKLGLKSRASAVWSAAKTEGSALRQGLQEFKRAPKATMAKDLKSLKERAVSIPNAIKTRLPARPQGVKLPAIKSLFSRSAKSVPPTPSASVKAGVEKILQARSGGAEAIKLGNTRESLADLKTDLANVETLNKLLDDPTSFFGSGHDVTVKWKDNPAVNIRGEGLERAIRIKEAVNLAVDNHTEIRAAQQDLKNEISQLKSDVKSQKANIRETIKEAQSEAAQSEKARYEESLESLSKEREDLKTNLQSVKDLLKEVRAEHQSTMSSKKNNLKSQNKADKLYLNELKQTIKASSKQFDKDVKMVNQQLEVCNSAIKNYEKTLSKVRGHAYIAANSGLNAVRAEVKALEEKREVIDMDAKISQAAYEAEITLLEASINLRTQELDGLSSQVPLKEELEQAIEDAKNALSDNTQKIDDLKQQHRVDQRAIKKAR